MKIKLLYNPDADEWEILRHDSEKEIPVVVARCWLHADALAVRRALLEEQTPPPVVPSGLTLEP